jgi:acetyltransferase
MNAAQLRRVTVEGFAHYQQGLYELLEDAVRQGASIGFLDDFDRAQGVAYLSELKGQLESAERLLWVVVRNEQVLASVQLAPCKKANGRHRAEVQKLLVHMDFQRHGLATQLMNGAELEARRKGLSLLFLDTEARSPAEAFYKAAGYTRVGEIPDYAGRPDGTLINTALYYKLLQGLPA